MLCFFRSHLVSACLHTLTWHAQKENKKRLLKLFLKSECRNFLFVLYTIMRISTIPKPYFARICNTLPERHGYICTLDGSSGARSFLWFSILFVWDNTHWSKLYMSNEANKSFSLPGHALIFKKKKLTVVHRILDLNDTILLFHLSL